jgi:hypothetical protein
MKGTKKNEPAIKIFSNYNFEMNSYCENKRRRVTYALLPPRVPRGLHLLRVVPGKQNQSYNQRNNNLVAIIENILGSHLPVEVLLVARDSVVNIGLVLG